ncbi:MAG TPA: hypothetical protein VE733_17310, partial [Streptosporangiaceae bacterium]|nr:hypothetical protein [Streptosporangiaceae bacterium]
RVLAAPETVMGGGLFADQALSAVLTPAQRSRAVEALCASDRPRAMELAVLLLRQDPDPGAWEHSRGRDILVSVLVSGRNPAAAPYLAERARDPGRPEDERVRAILDLTKLDGAGVLDQLAELAPSVVRDENRLPVVRKLNARGDARAGDIIAGWLTADRDARAAWLAGNQALADPRAWWSNDSEWKLRELIELRHPAAAAALEDEVARLRSRHGDVNYDWAIKQAADLSDAGAARLLAGWAQDSKLRLGDRIAAFRALAVMHTSNAAGLLSEVMDNPELSHRDRRALKAQLTPGPSPAEALFLKYAITEADQRLVHRLFDH